MDFQLGFNWAVGIIGVLGGIVLKTFSDSLKTLQAADGQLADKVQRIEVLVAGQYVTNNDLEKLSTALFHKLDKISDKLDTKMDKP